MPVTRLLFALNFLLKLFYFLLNKLIFLFIFNNSWRNTMTIFQIKCLVKIKGNRDKVRKEIDSKTCIDICQYKAAYVECQFAKQESRSAAITRISLQAAFHKAAQQYECEQREEGGRPHLYRQE